MKTRTTIILAFLGLGILGGGKFYSSADSIKLRACVY